MKIFIFILITFNLYSQEIKFKCFDKNDTIIKYKAFSVCYDKAIKESHWSSTYLCNSRLQKNVNRKSGFTTDQAIKKISAKLTDYKIKNYDIGHLTNADDMRFNQQAQTECFYFTNVCPQYFSFNRGCWNSLENYCRVLATTYDTVKIISGVIYLPDDKKRIVPIPMQFWKIVQYDTITEYYLFPNVATQHDFKSYQLDKKTFNDYIK